MLIWCNVTGNLSSAKRERELTMIGKVENVNICQRIGFQKSEIGMGKRV